MSAQVIPVPVPEGFEWRGEKRAVKKGEWFMDIEGCAVQWVMEQSRISGFILHPLPRRAKGDHCSVMIEHVYNELPIIPDGYEQGPFAANRPLEYTFFLGLHGSVMDSNTCNWRGPVLWLKKVSQ